MGVTTDKINKPFNPRGNDQSPLAFNRAKLYSGKALDFDGVNDWVNTAYVTGFTGAQEFTYCAYINADTNQQTQAIIHGNENVGWGLQSLQVRTETNGIRFFAGTGSASTSYVDSDPIEANKWYLVVGTHTPTENKIYLNGVLNATATASSLTTAPQTITIGAYPGPSVAFNGEISSPRIFDVALTAAQVADLYNNPEKVVPTGVADSNLKLWLPMMEGAGTTAYNGAPDALGSEEVTNGTFDTDSDWIKGTGWSIANGKASKVAGSATELVQLGAFPSDFSSKTFKISFTLEVTAGSVRLRAGLNNQSYLNSSGSYVYCLTPTGNDQIKFGADSSFVGSIDNVSVKEISNNGTISGATWTHGIGAPVAQTSVIDWNKHTLDGTNAVLIPQGLTSGRDLLGNLFENVRKQGALNLDGNSWAEVHDNESLDMTDAITLEAWVYADEFADMNGTGIISKWDEVSKQSYLLYALDYNTYYFFISSNGSNNDNVSFNLDSADENKYNHFVCVYDGSNITMFKNGNVAVTKTTALSSVYVSDKVLEIGRYDLSTGRAIETQIAQPRIYNRALTAEEVQRNYNAGKNTYTN